MPEPAASVNWPGLLRSESYFVLVPHHSSRPVTELCVRPNNNDRVSKVRRPLRVADLLVGVRLGDFCNRRGHIGLVRCFPVWCCACGAETTRGLLRDSAALDRRDPVCPLPAPGMWSRVPRLLCDKAIGGGSNLQGRTRRSSEREPAVWFRFDSRSIVGWLPSLTFAFDSSTHRANFYRRSASVSRKCRASGVPSVHLRAYGSLVSAAYLPPIGGGSAPCRQPSRLCSRSRCLCWIRVFLVLRISLRVVVWTSRGQ
jgi:hypothetical protein